MKTYIYQIEIDSEADLAPSESRLRSKLYGTLRASDYSVRVKRNMDAELADQAIKEPMDS